MRLEKLDILRWIAILFMVIFHVNYSLVNLFNIQLINFSDLFWFILWKTSAIIFIVISWIAFYLAEKKHQNKVILKYIKISLMLWLIAWGISLSTFLFFPEEYIRFWIIHFFSVCFVLILFFRAFKYYNIILAIFIIIFGFYFIPLVENDYSYFLWFKSISFSSSDYYPILPYFWFMLIWYSIATYLSDKGKMGIFKLKSNKNIIHVLFEYMWKKSLIIYLVHQPIIIWIIYTYFKILINI